MNKKAITAITLCCIFISCKRTEQMKTDAAGTKGQIVELAPITLKEGVSEEMLLSASEALQKEFVEKQEGFIKRELLKKSEKEYLDLVYWDSQASADKAMQNAMKSPACASYFQCMEDASQNDPNAGVSHFLILDEYNK